MILELKIYTLTLFENFLFNALLFLPIRCTAFLNKNSYRLDLNYKCKSVNFLVEHCYTIVEKYYLLTNASHLLFYNLKKLCMQHVQPYLLIFQ